MSEPPMTGQLTGMLLLIAFMAVFCVVGDRINHMRGVRRIKRRLKSKMKGLHMAAPSIINIILQKGRFHENQSYQNRIS
jgi:hypothetical protein